MASLHAVIQVQNFRKLSALDMELNFLSITVVSLFSRVKSDWLAELKIKHIIEHFNAGRLIKILWSQCTFVILTFWRILLFIDVSWYRRCFGGVMLFEHWLATYPLSNKPEHKVVMNAKLYIFLNINDTFLTPNFFLNEFRLRKALQLIFYQVLLVSVLYHLWTSKVISLFDHNDFEDNFLISTSRIKSRPM